MNESQINKNNFEVDVNCTFCGKEIKCPIDMLPKFKKHMCFDCFEKIGDSIKNEDLDEVHIDVPMDKMDDFMPEHMASTLVEEAFPDVWNEKKEEFKLMSKKELAEEMFGIGAYIASQQMIISMKRLNDEKPDKQDINQHYL